MIELKLYRWSFQLYEYLVSKFDCGMHCDFLFLLVFLFVFVSWILVRALWYFHYKKNPIPQRIVHGTTIEILWIIFPTFFFIFFFESSIAECAGENSGEGGSTSSSKPEWQIALDLPANSEAPDCLRSYLKEQLKYLFNIGRKATLSEPMFDEFIDPLAVDKATVGFAKALLERVRALQLVHYNRGEHIPFKFATRAEKERLYSIVWEYADKD